MDCYYNRTARRRIRTYNSILQWFYHIIAILTFRHAVDSCCRLGRVYCGPLQVARRGLEHRQTVRHADARPVDRRGRVAEPCVRLLAQGGPIATGHRVRTAVAGDRRRTSATTAVVVDASPAVLRRPTSE